MPWIVVLESNGRLAESIRESLTEDGWQVDLASTEEAAAAAIREHAPQVILAATDAPGAADLLRRGARRAGGPGSVALNRSGGSPEALSAADEHLDESASANDLRLLVRALVTAGRAPSGAMPAEQEERLTSQDLFGDMLAEVEAEATTPRPAPSAAPQRRTAEAIEETLSGLLKQETKPSRPVPTRKSDEAVDDLLSKTLSGLHVGESAKRPAAAGAEKPPRPAPRKDQPEEDNRPAASPRAGRPRREQAVDRLIESVKPTPAPPPRKRVSKEIDLSSLDDLARGTGGDKTPSAAAPYATQKIPVPVSQRPPTAPVEFGQYTLLERIALGGMAEVWKARMKGVEGFQKTVAIKKILPHLTDSSDFVTMFIDEAKLAAQLNHNNIIHIYDLGKIDADYYIAMEYVDGKDLRSILNTAREQTRPLPLGLALLVASRVAAALDHAHLKKDFEGREMGLVHRDVSPQNVLISFEGDIKLCDFGIVKAVSKASKTQMGALKGKLQYMSPEQAWGRPVDARSDIFSLGSVLFEMLTGQRLFSGESEMSVLDAVREGRIQAPRDLDPRVPLEVNALVLKALAREPRDRYGSAGDFQHEIDAVLGSLKPTPAQRDLAVYIQGLFASVPRATTAPAAEPASAPPTPARPSPRAEEVASVAPVAAVTTTGGGDAALESVDGGAKNLLWIGIAAIVLLGLGGLFFYGRHGGEKAPPPPASSTPALADTTPAATTPAAAPPQSDAAAAPSESTPATAASTGATEQLDVSKIVAGEVKKQADELKKKYDAELQQKQQELAAAKASAPAPPVTSQPEPQKRSTAESKKKPAEKAGKSEPSAQAAAATAQPASPATGPSAQNKAGNTPPVEDATNPAAAPAQQPAATAPQKAAPQTVPAAVPPAKKTPAVRLGDLVEPGPGVTPPVLVSFKKPEYPPLARRMRVEGTVVLSLLVDENGRVIDVRLDSGVRENVGINEAALAAAKSAHFQPALKDGVRVKMWHQLKIPFRM